MACGNVDCTGLHGAPVAQPHLRACRWWRCTPAWPQLCAAPYRRDAGAGAFVLACLFRRCMKLPPQRGGRNVHSSCAGRQRSAVLQAGRAHTSLRQRCLPAVRGSGAVFKPRACTRVQAGRPRICSLTAERRCTSTRPRGCRRPQRLCPAVPCSAACHVCADCACLGRRTDMNASCC